ncbi:MAG: hypothetical protein KJO83_07150 [Bacteroidia bacterium]|nr:hypothetical protein [Bacteroidia bacterium]
MRKLILALGAVLILASFTNSTNNTIILKDIDGTLLQSYPVIEQVNGDYTVTFTVDANTVVTTSTVNNTTQIYLVENGNSNVVVTHSITVKTAGIDFNNYFETDYEVASIDNEFKKESYRGLKKPRTIL